VIVGEELAHGRVPLRNLGDSVQEVVPLTEVPGRVGNAL
jgi:hypothetical protein